MSDKTQWKNAVTRIKADEYAALEQASAAQSVGVNAYLYAVLYEISDGFRSFPRVKRFPRKVFLRPNDELEQTR